MGHVLATDEVEQFYRELREQFEYPHIGHHLMTPREEEQWRAEGRRQRESEQAKLRWALTHDSTGKEV